MTGPEHYKEAERLLTEAADRQADFGHHAAEPTLHRAQVHATLALAAATAELDCFEGYNGTGRKERFSVAWAPLLVGEVTSQ